MAQTLLAHLKAAPGKTGMYVPFHKARWKTHHQGRHLPDLAPSLSADLFYPGFLSAMMTRFQEII